jgi:5'-nucleotidase
MSRPLILVTNDDGMFAPGIKALVECVGDIGEIVVVAPNSPQSGKGHAVTLDEPIRLNQVDVFPGIEAYECSGTPADCVKIAKHLVLKDREVDLCLSGINHGSNASINILYSGTMSAAMEASLEGINSIGFSLLDYSFDANFEPSKPYVKHIIRAALREGLGSCKLLNVNIPNLDAASLKGVRICRQAEGRWTEEFREAEDPRGEKYYWLTGNFTVFEDKDDTDMWALEHGFISVVPSRHDLTDYESLGQLSHLVSRDTMSLHETG